MTFLCQNNSVHCNKKVETRSYQLNFLISLQVSVSKVIKLRLKRRPPLKNQMAKIIIMQQK